MTNGSRLLILRTILKASVFGIILFNAACGKNPDDGKISDTTPTSHPSTVQSVPTHQKDTPPMTPPATSTLQNLTELAREDLAQRLSVPVTQISLIEAKEVTWSDSSLGCPQEGFAYAQVLTPGYLIILEYANKPFEYHAGKGSDVFYCTNPTPPSQGIPDNT